MRNLATIERVVAINAIPDADAIESVVVRGWTVVSKKNEFQVGDRCLYLEIDSALPLADDRFAFLASRGTKTTPDGKSVHVLKTARLRGVYSQGLVLPIRLFPELTDAVAGDDVSELLGIEKWEPPLPAGLTEAIGPFPTDLARKTDAERVQNLVEVYSHLSTTIEWIATEKVDGTSATIIRDETGLRVCGRNFELSLSSMHGQIATALGLVDRMVPGDVIQGELYGEGIQANPLQVRGRHLAVFGFYRNRVPVPRAAWPEWLAAIATPTLHLTPPATVEEAVAQVEKLQSAINPQRAAEGVVWHTADGSEPRELENRDCFKVISNHYLLKHG